MNNALFQRIRIFPRSTFTRIGIPVVQPPAGSLKPYPSKVHSTINGLWR